MAIAGADLLADLLLPGTSNRILTERENLWLWLKVRDEVETACRDAKKERKSTLPGQKKIREGDELMSELERMTLLGDGFGNPIMRNSMVPIIRARGLTKNLKQSFSTAFVPEKYLRWIGAKGRCSNWLLHRWHTRYRRSPRLHLPYGTDSKTSITALIDFWDVTLSDKLVQLTNMESDWKEFLDRGVDYSWFTKRDKSKEKCEIAYDWYLENHPHILGKLRPKFARLDDVQMCLDTSDLTVEEINDSFTEIKKAYNVFRSKENKKGKKQTNVGITKEAQSMLSTLAQKSRLTQTEVVERLIRHAKDHGMPH